jgi:hypothetical protein
VQGGTVYRKEHTPIGGYPTVVKRGHTGPGNNFWELKINIATFLSLLWVLFGLECNYHKGLRNIYKMLELKDVMALKANFRAENLHIIVWPILDNGMAFFNYVKTTFDFKGPGPLAYPQSHIIDILQKVPYATPVDCMNFPEDWKQKTKSAQDKQGTQPIRSGRGQQWTGDNSQQRAGYMQGQGDLYQVCNSGGHQGYDGGRGQDCSITFTRGQGANIKGDSTPGAIFKTTSTGGRSICPRLVHRLGRPPLPKK